MNKKKSFCSPWLPVIIIVGTIEFDHGAIRGKTYLLHFTFASELVRLFSSTLITAKIQHQFTKYFLIVIPGDKKLNKQSAYELLFKFSVMRKL